MSEERIEPGNLPDEEPIDDFEEEIVEDEPDEPAEPDESDADAEQVAEPQRQQRRPGRRERQSAELRELRERVERQERELGSFRSQQTQPRVDPGEQARRDEAERQQVAQLPYDQQISYWRDKDRRDMAAALQQHQITTLNTLDRTSFEAASRVDPVRARLASQVEDLIRSENAAGRYPNREQAFYYLLGQETDRARREGRAGGQRQQAQRRVARQQTRPGGAGSDAGGGRARVPADSYEAALQRVAGKPLW